MAGFVAVMALIFAASPMLAFRQPDDGTVEGALVSFPGEGLDQARGSAPPRREVWVSVASLIEAARRGMEFAPRSSSEEDLSRIAFRVRLWLGGGPGDTAAWVLRRAKKDERGYVLIMANLDSGKVYEVRIDGPDMIAREVDWG